VVTFVGEVMQSVNNNPLSNPVAVNNRFDALGSQVPQAGPLNSALDFDPAPDDFLYLWDETKNPPGFADAILQYFPADPPNWAGGWSDGVDPNPIDPTIQVGEGFFLFRSAAGPTAWTRTFTVNPTP
jgi:hypothetical protein